ncbi:hypothetical protein ACPMCT_17365 [Clostridioides difficile]|uniref:hypothetical protein n=1 Tax=Clostridioides difficile TaxID=1496 RepID=UPI00038CBF75|nr:hypothetical protein [Clostridioides difficile]EQJ94772.1 putative membrane protein [Clostridioides difficile P49]MBY1863283.1 hypothetical protein [Clostridioides difficile]MBZ0706776.1 hypothetical protein [Clostridioides difficile]MCH7327271.1 hypothetical protein [Clostridioides difficile]MCI4737422.1 hypothetical protein [Clostridioides difficile]
MFLIIQSFLFLSVLLLFIYFILTKILGNRSTFLEFIADIFWFLIKLSFETFSDFLSLLLNFRDRFSKEK